MNGNKRRKMMIIMMMEITRKGMRMEMMEMMKGLPPVMMSHGKSG